MTPKIKSLSMLHILNDGFQACILLLLPFIAKDLHINLSQVGLLGGALNTLQVVLALPAGYLAYKFGGYKLLLGSLLLYSLGYLGLSVSPIFILVFISFMLAGLGFGIFHPIAFAEVANNSEKENRGRLMGNFTAIGNIGRIGLSTVITFVIAYIGWRNSSITFAVIGFLSFVLIYKGVNKNTEHLEINQKQTASENDVKSFLSNKKFILSTMSAFLDSFASSALFVFLPFLLLFRGVDPKVLGVFTAAFFVGNFLGKTALGRLTDKFGNTKVFIISEILMGILILILSNSTLFPIIIVSSIILGFFTKGTVPVITTMVSESIEGKSSFEKGFGINAFITSIATVLAPILLGFISYKYGIVSAFGVSAIFALLATIPAFIYTKIND